MGTDSRNTLETHQKKYDCCDKEVSVSEAHDWENGVCKVCNYQCEHTGGNATCVKKRCVQYVVKNMALTI